MFVINFFLTLKLILEQTTGQNDGLHCGRNRYAFDAGYSNNKWKVELLYTFSSSKLQIFRIF